MMHRTTASPAVVLAFWKYKFQFVVQFAVGAAPYIYIWNCAVNLNFHSFIDFPAAGCYNGPDTKTKTEMIP